MSRWAWFTAHRSAAAGAAAPRTHGADGRALRRPWRVVPPAVADEVQRRRAGRVQPAWPRLVGVLLLVVAGVAAVHPVEPIPTHVAASASARPGFYLRSLHAVSPAGDLTDPPPLFRWRANGGPGAVAFVLCAADYTEIDRIAGIDGDVLVTTEALRERLTARGTFHWFVEAEASGRTVRSRLASFTIR